MRAFTLRVLSATSSRNARWTALALVLLASIITPVGWAQEAAQQPAGPTRVEKDLLGEKQIPADAYYGVQTARALENFQLSGVAINHYPGFVEAWAYVKLAVKFYPF